MKTKIRNIWENVRTSFWFIPGLMVLCANLSSFVFVAVDRTIQLDSNGGFGIFYTWGPEGARSILATIAGSMITVAGVTFSITIVSLTLAASQFGPRLLRNFMLDTGNQVVLGTFVSTFVYCLLVLGSIAPVEGDVFIPTLSVHFAIILVLVNVAILIFFIHHVSTSIQADHVIQAVYAELSEHLHRLFPEASEGEAGDKSDGDEWEGAINDKEETENGLEMMKENHGSRHHIHAFRDGYLQAIETNSLLEIARTNDLMITLHYEPGEFVVVGDTLVSVKGKARIDDELLHRIGNLFIMGRKRTPEQDAAFAFLQLVEVAVRALSPGINDPFTAIACIDRIGAALCFLTKRKFPSPRIRDEEGRPRLLVKPITFSRLMNVAYDPIRRHGRSSVAVTVRLLEMLTIIASQAKTREQNEAVSRQADMIVRASDLLPVNSDRKEIRRHYHKSLQTV